jgi:hypothetical protein
VEEAAEMTAEDFRDEPDAAVEPLDPEDEQAGVEPLSDDEEAALEELEEEWEEEEASGSG